jgi:hypothetical protein
MNRDPKTILRAAAAKRQPGMDVMEYKPIVFGFLPKRHISYGIGGQ